MKPAIHVREVRNHFTNTDNFPGLDFTGEASLTDQSQARECDVNNIIERFTKTGVLKNVDSKPMYGDFTNVPSYQQSLDMIRHANDQFMSLDAKIRRRFDNDPGQLLDFLSSPANLKEAIELGLVSPTPSPAVPASPSSSNVEAKSVPGSVEGAKA